jgi:hypothetical protein
MAGEQVPLHPAVIVLAWDCPVAYGGSGTTAASPGRQ